MGHEPLKPPLLSRYVPNWLLIRLWDFAITPSPLSGWCPKVYSFFLKASLSLLLNPYGGKIYFSWILSIDKERWHDHETVRLIMWNKIITLKSPSLHHNKKLSLTLLYQDYFVFNKNEGGVRRISQCFVVFYNPNVCLPYSAVIERVVVIGIEITCQEQEHSMHLHYVHLKGACPLYFAQLTKHLTLFQHISLFFSYNSSSIGNNVSLSVCRSVGLSIGLSVGQSVCLSVCP